MKRLKSFLLGMEPNSSTYRDMYEGELVVYDPSTPTVDPYPDTDPTYYRDTIGYAISTTHKLAQSRPTVVIAIPARLVGICEPSNAVADYCLRAFAPYVDGLNAELYNRSRPPEETGRYYLHRPGGEILVRNTAYFATCSQKGYENGGGCRVNLIPNAPPPELCLCVRMQVQLPLKRHKKAAQMLCRDLPDAVDEFLSQLDPKKLDEVRELAQKQSAIREYLRTSEYCAFIANGSILPRAKNTDFPMSGAVPFQSPPGDEITIQAIKGMGVRRGVTVITGGGYSGKSTLLDAISSGIYDHSLGDGRELCITDETAVTITAEDGRSVQNVNISPFIKWLPGGDTQSFTTDRASGSTSQAANIMEAVDSGSRLLLIDEDRSATNFMIRDAIMRKLIEKEPITPFTDRVNELFSKKGVSTILVIGGSGEYLSVADRVYMMQDFYTHDVTSHARAVATSHKDAAPPPACWHQHRELRSEGFTSYPSGMGTEKLEVLDLGVILLGDEQLDARGLRDIVSRQQLDALAFMLRLLEIRNVSSVVDLTERLDELYSEIARDGLDIVYSSFFTTGERFLELPRKLDVEAAVNRMRKVKIVPTNRR